MIQRWLVDDGARKPPADWLARLREVDPTVEVLWQGATPAGHRWEVGQVQPNADRQRRAGLRLELEWDSPLNPMHDEDKLRIQRDAKERRIRFAKWTVQGFCWQREMLQTTADDHFFANLLLDWREGCWLKRHPEVEAAVWQQALAEASGEAQLIARQAIVKQKVQQDGPSQFRRQMLKARSFAYSNRGAA